MAFNWWKLHCNFSGGVGRKRCLYAILNVLVFSLFKDYTIFRKFFKNIPFQENFSKMSCILENFGKIPFFRKFFL